MAQKKELSEQEKVSLILQKAGVNYDPKKAQAQIALNTRCKRCGRSLSSLERLVFENRCVACIKEETKKKRDSFVIKYIVIAFAFIVSLMLGAFCSQKSASQGWKIAGTVISSIVTGISLVFVFYTNMDKMFPNVPLKWQVWCCFIVAAIVDAILCLMIVLFNSWILYILLMLAVGAYLAYIAYGEYNDITDKYNLIEVYKRKSHDPEYIESITEALETRNTVAEEELENETVTDAAEGSDISDNSKLTAKSIDLFEIIKKKEAILEKKAKQSDKRVDSGNSAAPPKNVDISEPTGKSDAAEESEDSGEFFI